MSRLMQLAAGACAGAIAVGLGLLLLPQLEQAARGARQAVAKPVFVAAPAPAVAPAAPPPLVVAAAPLASAPAPAAPVEAPVKDDALAKLAEALRVAPGASAPSMPTRSLSFASTDTIRAAPSPAASNAAAPGVSDHARQIFAQGLVAMAGGDIAAARALLNRAVQEGDARALMALGETYEPATLTGLGALGVKGDAARARDYYNKALAAGVGAARERLAALESN